MKSIINITQLLTIAIILVLIQACGGESTERSASETAQTEKPGLSAFELEHGIGPVTERIQFGDKIDDELVNRGQNIFEMKCEMCHNMQGRMVGPELGNVMERRSGEFVMNFILNPSGMVREHPVGQELLREHMTAMPFQNVEEEDARAIVEFLREYNQNN